MPKPPTKMLKERANKRGCETRRVSVDRARPTCALRARAVEKPLQTPNHRSLREPKRLAIISARFGVAANIANFGTFGRLFGRTHFQTTKIQVLSHLRATKNPSQRTAFSSASTTTHRWFPLCILNGREMCSMATSTCCRRLQPWGAQLLLF